MKWLIIRFPNDEHFKVPAHIVADNCATYCANTDHPDKDARDPVWLAVYRKEYAETMNNKFYLTDWAGNNMDWEDLLPHAIRIECESRYDYEDEFMSAELSVREEKDEGETIHD